MTSTRLPGKVLADIAGKPALERMIERVKRVPSLDGIVVATTTNSNDDPIEDLAERLGVSCYRGSEHDVLDRVLKAAQTYFIDSIVELTGDCPLIDPEIVEAVIQLYRESGADYASNILTRTFPIGMDTQVFATRILEDVARRTDDQTDHEHVSLFIYRHPEIYRLVGLEAESHLARPDLRLTLDTAEDLAAIRAMFDTLLPKDPWFALESMITFLDSAPEVAAINAAVQHRHV